MTDLPMIADRGTALPQGRAAWAAYAVVMIVLAASSAAPFIRFGHDGPTLTVSDVGDATVYILTWAPFIIGLGTYMRWAARREPAVALWVTHALLLFTLPAAHTLTFLAVRDVIHDGAISTGHIGTVPFQVLVLLATLQYLVVVAVGLAVAAGHAMEHERVRVARLALTQARLETQLTRARVAALRAQLQPHFLFNTLNSISVLTSADPGGARTMIRRLSDLLRAALSERDRPAVPLSRELELLNAYLAIQVVRFGERLRVRVDVEPAAADCLVPTLVLQPLVENAIQYAVAEREEGGSVIISARRIDGRLILRVVDDGTGCHDADGPPTTDADARGLGHRNTRERLREMYGSAQVFAVERAPGGGCAVRVELPT
jgi:signal transduction histidine kinase